MSSWNRREFLAGTTLFAIALGVLVDAVALDDMAEPEPSSRQRKLLREVSQLTLPRTETPGAGEIGVGDFVAIALAHGLDGTDVPITAGPAELQPFQRRDGSLRYIAWLEAVLDQRAGRDFLALSPSDRLGLLAALDAEAFAAGASPGGPAWPWRKLKSLILNGYYTSEVGGAQELRFELIPGRYDPDVPVTPKTRAFSSNWAAVTFG